MLSDEDLAKLEAAEKAADEAPWSCTGNTFYVAPVSREKPGQENFHYFVMPGNSNTAHYIAISRNLMPTLIAEVKSIRAQNERLLRVFHAAQSLTAEAREAVAHFVCLQILEDAVRGVEA